MGKSGPFKPFIRPSNCIFHLKIAIQHLIGVKLIVISVWNIWPNGSQCIFTRIIVQPCFITSFMGIFGASRQRTFNLFYIKGMYETFSRVTDKRTFMMQHKKQCVLVYFWKPCDQQFFFFSTLTSGLKSLNISFCSRCNSAMTNQISFYYFSNFKLIITIAYEILLNWSTKRTTKSFQVEARDADAAVVVEISSQRQTQKVSFCGELKWHIYYTTSAKRKRKVESKLQKLKGNLLPNPER